MVSVFAYRVFAKRINEPMYEALCTSTYLNNDGKWLHLSHQQIQLSLMRDLPEVGPNGLQGLGKAPSGQLASCQKAYLMRAA